MFYCLYFLYFKTKCDLKCHTLRTFSKIKLTKILTVIL